MARKQATDRTPVVDWRGASGAIYRYWSYRLPAHFEPGFSGNYIYVRQEGERWVPLYIGEDDLHRAVEAHPCAECLRALGATHIHANQGGLHQVRRDEAADILAAHPEASAPTGCHPPRRKGRI